MTNTTNETNTNNTNIDQAIKVISYIEHICPTTEIKRFDSKKGIVFNTNLDKTTEEHFYVLESMKDFIEVEQITINVVLL